MTRSDETGVGEVSSETPRNPPRGRAGKRSSARGANGAPRIKRTSGHAKGNKPAQKRKPRQFDQAKLDQFGFRLGSKKSKAAAMYGGKNGATLGETKKKLGSAQYNVLTELQGKGFKIKRTPDTGDEERKVTRFYLIA